VPRENVKKNLIAILLVAVVLGAAAVYVMVGKQSGLTGVKETYPVDSAGGLIATSDGKVALDVPAEALTNQTVISIEPIQNAAFAGYTVISSYQFGPEGTSFVMPATLNITYNPQTLPSDLNQSDLRLFTSTLAGFGQVENSSVDTVSHVVSGQINHFSRIHVAASKSTPEPATALIVGRWNRQDGADRYTFFANTTTKTYLNGNIYYGKWDYDGTGGKKYVLHWQHSPPGREPFIDWITIADNGQTYSGYNNYNNSIYCVRVASDQPPNAEIASLFPPNTILPVNKVEVEITARSASTDPDDPISMLSYFWTVTSPSGEVLATSNPNGESTSFTPRLVGDYVVALTVSDSVLKDSTAITVNVKPNVKITMTTISTQEYPPKDIDVVFVVANLGDEPVEIKPYVYLWGARAAGSGMDFQIGPYLVSHGQPFVVEGSHTVTEISGTIPVPPAADPVTETWTITLIPYNAFLTVYGQTSLYYWTEVKPGAFAPDPFSLTTGIKIYAPSASK
jgi:hypothetical protein